MKIATHNGHFHADELLAIAALLMKYPDATIVRSRDPELVASADIVVDVGHIYDPGNMRFDHHQTEGAGKRENGIPYASFGLVWKEWGKELAEGSEEARIIEEKLVMPVDSMDNGILLSTPVFKGVREYSIGDFFESFADGLETLEEQEEAFYRALPIARELLAREIVSAKRTAADWRRVRSLYEESVDKRIIVLPDHIHWKRILVPTEALFVLFPRRAGEWAARAVPQEVNGFDVKKPFPSSWSGLNDTALAGASGVSDAVFCHRDGFLCAARSQEGALKLAQIALES